MKYLCLCYYDAQKFTTLTPAEVAAIGPECQPYDVALRATGKMVSLGSLSLPAEWRTIKPVNGKPVVTPGPISAAAQQAGAFFIIDAANMDEAIAVASKHATANVGENLGFALEVCGCEMFE